MQIAPGPNQPLAVQTLRWLRQPIPTMQTLARDHGDVIHMKLAGLGDLLLLSHPDDVKMVFALSPDVGLAGQANYVLAPFLGRSSVLVSDGNDHARLRRLMMPAFQGERMQAFGHTMLDRAHAAVDRFPVFTPFSFHDRMQDVTLDVILRTIFGVTVGADLAELTRVLKQTLDLLAWPGLLLPVLQHDFGAWSPWGKFQRQAAEVERILHREIARRRAEPDGSIASSLVHATGEGGEKLSDQEIAEQLITLLVAGHETTATALSWGLAGILEEPALHRDLLAELATVPDLAPENLARLPLLDATVKESLRRRPVIPIVGRKLTQPMTIRGYDVPAGTVLAPCIYLAHHREEAFPDAYRFDPRRFLRDKPTSFELFPFGGGGRRCIGAAFAMYEMKMIFAAVLSRLTLRRASSRPTSVVRRSITLAPSEGLPLVCVDRRRRLTS